MGLMNSIKRFFSSQKAQTYFIEFRIQGGIKRYSKKLIRELSKKFGMIGVNRKRVIPHLTILIPFKTKYPDIMIKGVVSVLRNYKPMRIKTRGFNYFDNPKNKVIYISFSTPNELLMLRNDLASALNSSLPDLKKKFIIRKKPDFHLALAFREIDKKFKKIWNYIKKKKIPHIEVTLNRITIISKNKIYREIDLRNHRVLTRKEVLFEFNQKV